jgi:hypothetical protein
LHRTEPEAAEASWTVIFGPPDFSWTISPVLKLSAMIVLPVYLQPQVTTNAVKPQV